MRENMELNQKRTRAPGGGRKPKRQGEPGRVVSVWLTEKAIAVADATGNRSQAIEEALRAKM